MSRFSLSFLSSFSIQKTKRKSNTKKAAEERKKRKEKGICSSMLISSGRATGQEKRKKKEKKIFSFLCFSFPHFRLCALRFSRPSSHFSVAFLSPSPFSFLVEMSLDKVGKKRSRPTSPDAPGPHSPPHKRGRRKTQPLAPTVCSRLQKKKKKFDVLLLVLTSSPPLLLVFSWRRPCNRKTRASSRSRRFLTNASRRFCFVFLSLSFRSVRHDKRTERDQRVLVPKRKGGREGLTTRSAGWKDVLLDQVGRISRV